MTEVPTITTAPQPRQDELETIYEEYLSSTGNTDEEDETTSEDTQVDDNRTASVSSHFSADGNALSDEEVLAKARTAKNSTKFNRLWQGSSALWTGNGAEYESPSEATLALCRQLAFWTGGDPEQIDRLVRRSGLMRDKWDEKRGDSTWGAKRVAKAIADQSAFYPPDEDQSELIPDGGTTELPKPPEDLRLVTRNGGYAIKKTLDDGDVTFSQLTNFQLRVDSYLNHSDGETYLEIEVHPRNESPYTVTVVPTVFNESRTFKEKVVTGRTTTFSGGERELNLLRRFVGSQDAPERTGTQHLGLHDNELVLRDGVFTADGWCDDPDRVYVERDIGLERKCTLTPGRQPAAGYDAEAVTSILRLLPQTRDPERFLPVLGWFYAAPLRSFIMEQTGQFSLLNVLGDTGAGKTATLNVLWELFGMEGDPLSVEDTKFTLTTTLAATQSLPLWYDEYKPSDIDSRSLDTFHTLIRKTTRGGVEQRGNADKSTDEYHLRAPVVISGEQRIQGPAEKRRGILTTFRASVTDPGTPTHRAFARLVGESYRDNGAIEQPEGYQTAFPQHALAYYRFLLRRDSQTLREKWRSAEATVHELLKAYSIAGVDTFPRQGLQTIVFGIRLYRDFAVEMGVDLQAAGVLTDDHLEEAVIYVARQVGEGGQRISHLDRLVELMARAAAADYLEADEHYRFVHEGSEQEELRVNLNLGFDCITRYVRDHDVSGEDLLNRKTDYDERIADAAEDDDTYITAVSQYTNRINRAVGIHVATAEAKLNGFDRSYFTDEGSEDTESRDEDQSPIDRAIPVEEAKGDSGYRDLTVKVADLRSNLPRNMTQAGTLCDTTAAIDFVEWKTSGTSAFDLDTDQCYYVENARIGTDPDDAPQIELKPGVTDVRPIQAGIGHTEPADSGGDRTLNDAAYSSLSDFKDDTPRGSENDIAQRKATDERQSVSRPSSSGLTQQDRTDKLRSLIQQLTDQSTDGKVAIKDLHKHVASTSDEPITPKQVDHLLDQWVERGDLIREDDYIRPT